MNWIDIFYTRDARCDSYPQVKSRFWKYAKPIKRAGQYEASLDIYGVEQPLWIFANVHYKLEKSPDFYKFKNSSDNFTVTSRMVMKSGQELQAAGTKAALKKSSVIESFDENWEKEWYFTRGGKFPMESWCLNDSGVPIPEYGKLVIEIKSQEPNKLKVEMNDYKAGAFSATFPVKGGNVSEKIEIYPFMLNGKDGGHLAGWQDVPRPRIVLGPAGKWNGATPEFKQIFWEGVQAEEFKKKRSQWAKD